MKIVGKLLHKLCEFPEYKDLEQEISSLQKYDTQILSNLQQAFGPSMSEFARSHDPELRDTLLKLQECGRTEIVHLRTLLSATSSLPNELRQIDEFHSNISRKRAELKAKQEEYSKCEKDLRNAIRNLDKLRSQGGSAAEISKYKTLYDDLCKQKQVLSDYVDKKRDENERLEIEYRKTIMHIILSTFEAFATANMKSMKEIASCGKQMHEIANEIGGTADLSIQELETRLALLEEELAETCKF